LWLLRIFVAIKSRFWSIAEREDDPDLDVL